MLLVRVVDGCVQCARLSALFWLLLLAEVPDSMTFEVLLVVSTTYCGRMES